MKEHVTYIRYFTVFCDEIDRKTGPVTVVPREGEMVTVFDKRDNPRWYLVEQVVWAVGKLATEAQVRLLPYTKV